MTIKEVARIAGVSPAAVSRFLNGGSVSEEKRERIRAVIDQTGYHPDPMAQTMRTGRGDQIGVIVPKINSDSASEIMAGVFERLTERNFVVMLGVSGGKTEREVSYIDSMQNNQVAGIILMGTVMTPELQEAIEDSEKPVVITGQNFEGFSCVYHNDHDAMRELTGRMLRKGRKTIAYIGALEEDAAAGKARREGAEEAWAENAECDPARKGRPLVQVTAGGFGPEDGRAAMKELFREHPDLDGVICATDRLAVGAMDAIHHAGKRIPEDIAVAGLGDSWVDPVTNPPLTSVHLYYRQCGIEAVNMLLEIMESGQESEPVQKKLEFTIIDRESM